MYTSTTVYIKYNPPGAVVHARLLDCMTTKRVPVPNGTSSDISRRDVSNADLSGTGTSSTVEISTMENRPRGV